MAAVCVWDVNDPTRTTSPQLVLRGHTGRVALAALDGRIASCDGDKVIRIWNVTDRLEAKPVTTLEGHTSLVWCLSPALRDTITRDVAQNVSKYEPRLPRPFLGFKSDSSLREGSVQPKAAYLLQPPKAPQE